MHVGRGNGPMVSFQDVHLEKSAQTLELRGFQLQFEAETRHDSGIRYPHFAMVRFESMRTDRVPSFGNASRCRKASEPGSVSPV